jgi:hypothetical protein
MPLRGPCSSDSVMVNEFTYRVLELIESGKTLEQVLDVFQRDYPEEDDQKLRVDLFHAASRLRKHDFVETGSFTENARILQNGRGLVPGSLQPCPIGHMPELSRFLLEARDTAGIRWLYNAFVKRPQGGSGPELPAELYDVERMAGAQVTGGEIFWAYVDDQGQLVGGASSSNYMLMTPVVSITAVAVAGGPQDRGTRAITMLSQLAEILSLFGLNEKIRITSCPAVSASDENMTIFDQAFFAVLAQCRFRKAATFPGEVDGDYDLEYYDCIL